MDKDAFLNSRNRPDLIVLSDATLSAVATELYDEAKGLQTLRDVLLVELKRGESTITRENIHQATDYVEDLLKCGHLDGSPFIRAFVVGHRASEKVEVSRTIGENPVRARVDVATYGQLVRTGEKRLFSLRERLRDRYEEISGVDLLKGIFAKEGQQQNLPLKICPEGVNELKEVK